MPYKIKTRITVNEGGEALWEGDVARTQQYMDIVNEYQAAGDMAILNKQYESDGTIIETVLWKSEEKRQEYGDRVIALLGGNPRTDPDAAALLTPNTIDIIEEGEISMEEWYSRT